MQVISYLSSDILLSSRRMFSFLYPASRRCLHITRWLYYNRNLLPRELDAIKSDCNLVDVRQPEELVHEMPAIPGAVNVPLGELEGRIGELPKENVVFICRGGVRSARALGIAEQAGFAEPRHLDGGMVAWAAEFGQKQ